MNRFFLVSLSCVALAACARSSEAPPLPGDSVSGDGAVSLATPKLVTVGRPEGAAGAAGAAARAGSPLSPIESRLYPAELVIENRQRLGLTAAQEQQITREVDRSQSELVKLQWELQARKDELLAVLASAKVDEAKAKAAAEGLMAKENAIKAVHLGMLVRVKNVLTAEQQGRLDGVREEGRCGGRDGGG